MEILKWMLAFSMATTSCKMSETEKASYAKTDSARFARGPLSLAQNGHQLIPDSEQSCSRYQESEFSQIGKYLAGVPLSRCSRLFQATKTGTYQKSMIPLNRQWKKQSQNHRRMANWWQKHYQKIPTSDVFYPFGGPDIANAINLFPKSKVFTLFGLENIGSIPRLDKYISKRGHGPARGGLKLQKMSRALYSILERNFFITTKMMKDFNPYSHISLSEIFMFFLAKHRAKIHQVSRVSIDHSGSISHAPNTRGTPGLSISFSLPILSGENPVVYEKKVMYYFQLNAMTPAFDTKHRGFIKNLERSPSRITLLKAASYLMNPRNGFDFSTVRRLILQNSHLIVQDDSGVPLRFLSEAGWHVKAYGIYEGTLNIFKIFRQKRLFAMTQNNTALPFAWGYMGGHNEGKSLLMIAEPKKIVDNPQGRIDSEKEKR